VRERMGLTVHPLCGPGSIPCHGGVFKKIFPQLITFGQHILSQCGRKYLNLDPHGATQSVEIEEEGRSPTTDRQWLKKWCWSVRRNLVLGHISSYAAINFSLPLPLPLPLPFEQRVDKRKCPTVRHNVYIVRQTAYFRTCLSFPIFNSIPYRWRF